MSNRRREGIRHAINLLGKVVWEKIGRETEEAGEPSDHDAGLTLIKGKEEVERGRKVGR